MRSHEFLLWELWESVVVFPEYNHAKASSSSFISTALVTTLLSRESRTSDQVHSNIITRILSFNCHYLHWIYSNRVDLRTTIRRHLPRNLIIQNAQSGKFSAGYDRSNVNIYLELLYAIISGLMAPVDDAVVMDIIKTILIQLHEPNDMIEWKDQVPVIQPYHEVLVKCCSKLISKKRQFVYEASEEKLISGASDNNDHKSSLAVILLQGIIKAWPPLHQANTAKEVLLLHEIELLIGLLTVEEYSCIAQQWTRRWCSCFESEFANVRTAQRALQIFKNERVLGLCCSDSHDTRDAFFEIMLPSLYKRGTLSWNPTVNKMTALAIQKLLTLDEPMILHHFSLILANPLIKGILQPSPVTAVVDSESAFISSESSPSSRFMPPPQISARQVPSFKTHVRSSVMRHPLGIVTGVAPWGSTHSDAGAPQHITHSIANRGSTVTHLPQPMIASGIGQYSRISDSNDENREIEGDSIEITSPKAILLKFIESCLPKESSRDEEILDPSSDWKLIQAAITPTILPNLKFHDLVFGKILGSGSFSTVKYARQILKDKTKTIWPEFAVKIVSSSLLTELNYHSSIIREMGMLQLLSHPGISRLISAFRYTQSAYMVLEYASLGDLHSYIMSNGALSHNYIRFIVGEIIAALISIHELGFSFNDLKPENVLITEIGHIKLTDFGATRPQTKEAQNMLQSSIAMLGTLRSGDWREEAPSLSNPSANVVNETGPSDDYADSRLEGTPAYLPPEVLLHKTAPNFKSDSWAVGCLTLFCYLGKPRYFGDREDVLQQIHDDFHREIGSFSENVGSDIADVTVPHVQFSGSATTDSFLEEIIDVSDICGIKLKSFLRLVLNYSSDDRISIQTLAQHAYLTEGSFDEVIDVVQNGNINDRVDINSLHFSKPKSIIFTRSSQVGSNTGAADNSSDKLWARRQSSVLWAPMPQEYNLDETPDIFNKRRRGFFAAHSYEMIPIEETEVERSSPFSRLLF